MPDSTSAPSFDVARRRGVLRRLLDEHPTPVFLASEERLGERYERLERCLAAAWPDVAIAYSFKTNYEVARARVFQRRGAWSEVVSEREYALARELGADGPRIVFNGPWKPDSALRRAFDEGAIVHLNDFDELDRVSRLAEETSGEPFPVGIRLRTKVKGIGRSRFGFSIEDGEARRAVERILASPRLRLVGTHCHLPADTDDPERYREAARGVADFLRRRVPSLDALEHVDMGGGFPAGGRKPYARRAWDPRPVEESVAAIVAGLAPAFPGRRPRLILEPGRYLVGDAVVLVSRVIARRSAPARQVVLSNASVTMLPATTYAPQEILAFTEGLEERTSRTQETTVFGASCREDDLLYRGPFPAVSTGDVLVHLCAGAYNASLAPEFIFERPRTIFW